MKKGFTLIELLIVMVVVSILVTVALPAYKTSMEKGRATEGISNASAISDAANAYYVRNGNSYGTKANLCLYVLGDSQCQGTSEDGGVAGVTKRKYFKVPSISVSGDTVTVELERNLSSNAYTITFTNSNGRVTDRSCSSSTTTGQKYCKAIGF